jgi:hypothetical protein
MNSPFPAEATERSFAPLTSEHLARLVIMAERDHLTFTRAAGRPEYAHRRVAMVLAQGAAQHYVDCANAQPMRTGVSDIDVWSFYAAIDGDMFPAYRRITSADFGPSALGTQSYDLSTARNARERGDWRKFSTFAGRRVDFMLRPLRVAVGATTDRSVSAIRAWLREGAANTTPLRRSSSWHLASRPVVLLEPADRRGDIIWPQA